MSIKKKATILVVEDQADTLIALSERLQAEGFTVLEASTVVRRPPGQIGDTRPDLAGRPSSQHRRPKRRLCREKRPKAETLQTIFHYLGCLVILLGIAVLGLALARPGIALLVGGYVLLVIEYVIRAVVGKENPDLGEACGLS